MAKITAIIDIGSNSMRMVVFKKTSRFAFHLIDESKSKVKISEGCYENNGNLQEEPMQRAFGTLESFLKIAKNLKSRKILCVATSALRDAPNKKQFLSNVSQKLKLNIKIIDGPKEAYYGGVAALNLIDCDNFSTLDIGGGSTEFAFVSNKKISDTVSLNIGTVRIKELFFDKGDLEGAKAYILDELAKIDKKIPVMVGLGGTARAVSKLIMKKDYYPLDIVHGFTYDVEDNIELLENIITATSIKELKAYGVKKERFDTIGVGVFIFKTILEFFKVEKVITSGAGVREGVYLCDILRNSNNTFPANFNPSVKSLLDRFVDDHSQSAYLGNNARKIFDVLTPLHGLDEKYRSILVLSSKLLLIGSSLNFYKNENHTFNYILNGLNYGFTHEDKILIAVVTKFSKKSLPKYEEIKDYFSLLPSMNIIEWLNFMMTLTISLNIEYSKIPFEYNLDDDTLEIISNQNCYLVQKELQKIKAPTNITIKLNKK